MTLISKLLSVLGNRRTTVCFRRPLANNVVILDMGNTTTGYLNEMLLPEYPGARLDIGVGQSRFILYLSPSILARAVLQFARLQIARREHNLSTRAIVRISYYVACLQIIRPKVVLDFLHVPDTLYLARYYPEAQYFTIMNGFCSDVLDFEMDDGILPLTQYQYTLARHAPKNATNVHIFCYGEKDVELFRQVGLGEHQTGIRYHACGPLMADFYLHERLLGLLPSEEFDICYCSQAGSTHITGTTDFTRTLMRSNDLITEYLRRYSETRALKIVVAMRTEEEFGGRAAEDHYFRSRFGDAEGFSLSPKENFLSSYGLMASSRVVLSLLSSTGFDAIRWGKKVLFAPFYLNTLYRVSSRAYNSDIDMWMWMVGGCSYEEFETKLDALLAIPQEQYIADISESASALSSYGNALPAHRYIRRKIFEACGIIDSPRKAALG